MTNPLIVESLSGLRKQVEGVQTMKSIKRMLFGIALILFGCLSPFTLITATDGVGAVGLIIAFIGLFVAFLALTAPPEKPKKPAEPVKSEETEKTEN